MSVHLCPECNKHFNLRSPLKNKFPHMMTCFKCEQEKKKKKIIENEYKM